MPLTWLGGDGSLLLACFTTQTEDLNMPAKNIKKGSINIKWYAA